MTILIIIWVTPPPPNSLFRRHACKLWWLERCVSSGSLFRDGLWNSKRRSLYGKCSPSLPSPRPVFVVVVFFFFTKLCLFVYSYTRRICFIKFHTDNRVFLLSFFACLLLLLSLGMYYSAYLCLQFNDLSILCYAYDARYTNAYKITPNEIYGNTHT